MASLLDISINRDLTHKLELNCIVDISKSRSNRKLPHCNMKMCRHIYENFRLIQKILFCKNVVAHAFQASNRCGLESILFTAIACII